MKDNGERNKSIKYHFFWVKEIFGIPFNAETQQQIVFSPSLIKKMPLPKKTLVGNFSNAEKVVKALGITFK